MCVYVQYISNMHYERRLTFLCWLSCLFYLEDTAHLSKIS